MFGIFKKKQNSRYYLHYFATALVTHCNLNCKYCDHFSPLAEKKFYSVSFLKKQFLAMNNLFNINSVALMGGEPLLHPQICQIIKMTRQIFDRSNILIYTNGILLNSMPEEFWLTCRKNDTVILISKYDINIDYDAIMKRANKYGVLINYNVSEGSSFRTMYKPVIDLEGKQNIAETYQNCWMRKENCVYLEGGKLFKCTIPGNIQHFNKYFGKDLQVTINDFLNIFDKLSYEKIDNYFCNPIDFCRYCNINAQKSGLKFEISDKDIKEWT